MSQAAEDKRAGSAGPSRKRIHAPLDPAARPSGLPAPWDRLAWRTLAPFRNEAKARVFWAQDGERRLVCKDGSLALGRPVVGRFRRWALANEARALAAMEGIEGVPRLVAHWRAGLIMEFVPGRLLTEHERGSVPAVVFERLDRIVDAIHARGLAIGDLHRRNILVDEQQRVHLVDFELAQDRRRGLGRLLGAPLQRLDRLAAARQRQYHGAPLDPAQAALLARRPLAYRLFRRLKRWLRAMRPRERAPR
ncbi:MAG TPA: lipopolysaccharide kinase InaA family protein [Planctomycetota bacterium]|nr:lipopolysaccharide kinase InaA family protein [Planctomycetota bacterium]